MAAREKARVTTLLDINSALLQEVINLQATGKAGSASNTDANPSDQAADPSKAGQKPSPEYMECMRRLQANLGYLATIADRAKKSGGVASPAKNRRSSTGAASTARLPAWPGSACE